MPLVEEELSRINGELHELRVEHRDLDQVIMQLTGCPSDDDLLIRRLKKRRLALKDRIESLETLLVPDVPA